MEREEFVSQTGRERTDTSAQSRELSRGVRRVHRRLKRQSSLDALVARLPAVSAFSSLVIAPRLVVGSGPPTWLALCAFLALAGLSWLEGRRRAPSELAAALLLDQRLDRRGQLAAAYDFSLSKHHDAYQALLLQSEASFLATSPVHQLALRVPRGWPVALICQCAFLIALAIPARQRPTSPAPQLASKQPPSETQPSMLAAADLAQLQQEADVARAQLRSDEAQENIDELRELLRELEHGSVSKEEAQRRTAALISELESSQPDAGEFSDQLRERGETLSQSKLGKQLGAALTEQRLRDAAAALRTLAERLGDKKTPLSPKELEELREAIVAAQEKKRQSDQAKGAQAAAGGKTDSQAQLRQKRERLLRKKQEGTASGEELQELSRTERELERLERRKKREEKTLSDLDRALAEAAREVQEMTQKSNTDQQKGEAGQTPEEDPFEPAAQGLEERAQRELTEDEKKELLRQLKRLKERLRQAEKDGTKREQLEQFERRARGRPGNDADPNEQTRPRVTLTPGKQSGDGPTDPAQSEAGAPRPGSGKQPGSEHDSNLSGEPEARLDVEATAAQAAAQDSGEGNSESETIRSAAEEGFTASSYEKLYTQYKTVLEQTMAEESIPASHRRSVQRYFELIRPRENNQK